MVIEERRRKRNTSRKAVCVICFKQTVLVVITYRYADRPVGGNPSCQTQVVIRTERIVINIVIPIGMSRTQQGFLCCTSLRVYYVDKLVIVQHVCHSRASLDGIGGAECDFQLIRVPFFGCNDNDTVRSARTIDSR